MARVSKQRAYEDANELALKRSIKVADIVRVTAFYPDKMQADVVPLVKKPDGGKYLSCTPILSVPVFCMSGGGYIVKPCYKEGDIGLLIYLDRDSDRAISTGGEAEPGTGRIHSGDDAVFVGGISAGSKTFGDFNAGSLTISSDDNAASIEISQGVVKITGSTVSIAGDLSLNGSIHLTGHLEADDYITSALVKAPKAELDNINSDNAEISKIKSESITSTDIESDEAVILSDAQINGIAFTQHKHPFTDGAGTTEPPS